MQPRRTICLRGPQRIRGFVGVGQMSGERYWEQVLSIIRELQDNRSYSEEELSVYNRRIDSVNL